MDLVEAYRNAGDKEKHRAGGLTLVCLDDKTIDESEYGRVGGRTVVPRSREEGGIMGLIDFNDRRYGSGVKRRRIEETPDGGFKVESEEDNFRPDKAAEALDLFSVEMLEEAGVEVVEEVVEEFPQDDPLAMLQKQAAESLANPGAPKTNGNADNTMMMQMMGLLTQVVASQSAPAKAIAPKPKATPVKSQVPTKNVVFSGDFGQFTVQYAGVVIKPEFVVLISQPDQPTMYKPPLTKDTPINLEIDGKGFQVVNFGLSFLHKGDILLLMPVVQKTEDPDAEKTE